MEKTGNRTISPVVAVLCAAYFAIACHGPAPTLTSSYALASLRIEVLPAGAIVYVNKEVKGRTPLILHLPPGTYKVRVQHEGYEALQHELELSAGEQRIIAEKLLDIAPPIITLHELPTTVEVGQPIHIHAQATDNATVPFIHLLIDGALVKALKGRSLEHIWDTKGATTGMHSIIVKASDEIGNASQVTHNLQVSSMSMPQTPKMSESPPSINADISVIETTITLLSYPYEPYLREKLDSQYNFKLLWLDRAAYEAIDPQPRPRAFKAVILENRYLSLTFLPELGGRLYKCVFKPSGQNVFYQNAVLKPSYWGPLSRDENWWLAAGGIEWALPVHEHGYEWGIPWTYAIDRQANMASLLLRDSAANDRLRAEVQVMLPSERAYFVIKPRLVNPTSEPISCQFWLNATLSLGSVSASANTDFIYPTEHVVVHSTGDNSLPGERQVMPWPIYNGRDLSHYGNWQNWLGVFALDIRRNYVGAYNHDTELGIVRIFPLETAPGLKLFAFGTSFPARTEYSDDGSDYFELWGGPCRTFWPEDNVIIGAAQSLSWSEVWFPFCSIGGLDIANAEAAIKVNVQSRWVHLGIGVSRAQQMQFQLWWNDQPFYRGSTFVAPDKPLLFQAPLPNEASLPGQLHVLLEKEDGVAILEYTKTIAP